ncbi:MAG: hypothetical protein SOH48_08700 [Eubacteriales bacterium]|jgi:hypothetical protein
MRERLKRYFICLLVAAFVVSGIGAQRQALLSYANPAVQRELARGTEPQTVLNVQSAHGTEKAAVRQTESTSVLADMIGSGMRVSTHMAGILAYFLLSMLLTGALCPGLISLWRRSEHVSRCRKVIISYIHHQYGFIGEI